ncbi:hypothetical protein [Aquabacterium humicola]|uniref:hypothetical protein n=1 Tax=Aquabacterium humicola TaxID=3237377 RepID=UPI002542E6C5|nr:hypothetical protein [Rubrivivax pictus]
MNRWFLSAGLLACFTALVHVFAGGPGVAEPLLRSSIDDVPRLTMYACWHLVSAALAGSGLALLAAARPAAELQARALVGFIAVLWLAFGLVILSVALQQPGAGWIWKMPQWLALMPVGLLGLAGLRRPAPATVFAN